MEPGYAGSRKTINQQMQALPGETQAQVGGLTAQAEQSHTDILDSARRRGMGFSGVPIGEQVKYDSTVFKPALAGLYSSQNARKTSLEESLNSLYRDQRNTAMGVQQQEVARDEQIRQFNEQMAWQREQLARQEQEAARARAEASRAAAASAGAGIGSYFGGSTAGAAPKAAAAQSNGQYGFKDGKSGASGFFFRDANGKSISAAKYAQLNGINITQLVNTMANKGDKGAASIMRGPGVDTSSQLFKKAFAWDL